MEDNFPDNEKVNTKPRKSKIWVVGNIYLYIISGNFLGVIIYEVISRIIPLKEIKTIDILFSLLMGLVILFFTTKLGVEFVIKRSAVSPNEFTKISLIVGIIPVIFSILVLFLATNITQNWSLFGPFLLPQLIGGIIIGAIYGKTTHFWFKRLPNRF